MPAKKPVKSAAAAPQTTAQYPAIEYPAIEAFIERATAEQIADLFGSLKEGLTALKGPRADQGKKVGKAIQKTEELLSHLMQVREKLEDEQKGPRR